MSTFRLIILLCVVVSASSKALGKFASIGIRNIYQPILLCKDDYMLAQKSLLTFHSHCIPFNPTEDNKVEDRIHADTWEIGDMKAKYGDRPYQVFVTNERENALCGGVLLEMNYVLTAAHCINGDENAIPKNKKVLVKAGIIKNRRDPYEQKQLVTMDGSHIKFNPNWNGDINKGRGEKVGDLGKFRNTYCRYFL